MSTTLLPSLFRHKAAIDDAFLVAIGAIDPDAHAADRHTAIRLMNHIHTVDRIFAGHLRGEPHGQPGTNTPETPALEALREAVAAVDLGYVELVDALTPPQLAQTVDFTFTDGLHGRMSREEMLAHVIGHGSYHRGAVGRILAQAGVAAPRDLFTAYLHRAEPARREPV